MVGYEVRCRPTLTTLNKVRDNLFPVQFDLRNDLLKRARWPQNEFYTACLNKVLDFLNTLFGRAYDTASRDLLGRQG